MGRSTWLTVEYICITTLVVYLAENRDIWRLESRQGVKELKPQVYKERNA